MSDNQNDNIDKFSSTVFHTAFTADNSIEAFPSNLDANVIFSRNQSSDQWEQLRRKAWSHEKVSRQSSSSDDTNKPVNTTSSWILEEENCKEKGSSFNDLESFLPQLNHPGKGRPKPPRQHRRGQDTEQSQQKHELHRQVEPGTYSVGPQISSTTRTHRASIYDQTRTEPSIPGTPPDSTKVIEGTDFERTQRASIITHHTRTRPFVQGTTSGIRVTGGSDSGCPQRASDPNEMGRAQGAKNNVRNLRARFENMSISK